MTKDDLLSAIGAGNDVAMQWYALTHQQTLPSATSIIAQRNAAGQASLQIGSGTIVLLGLAIVAVVLIVNN